MRQFPMACGLLATARRFVDTAAAARRSHSSAGQGGKTAPWPATFRDLRRRRRVKPACCPSGRQSELVRQSSSYCASRTATSPWRNPADRSSTWKRPPSRTISSDARTVRDTALGNIRRDLGNRPERGGTENHQSVFGSSAVRQTASPMTTRRSRTAGSRNALLLSSTPSLPLRCQEGLAEVQRIENWTLSSLHGAKTLASILGRGESRAVRTTSIGVDIPRQQEIS